MELNRTKNVATIIWLAPLDSAAPGSYKSGLTIIIDAEYSDGGGAPSSLTISGSFTEVGVTGRYYLLLTTGEMNHDNILITCQAIGMADDSILIITDLKTDQDAILVDTGTTLPASITPLAIEANVEGHITNSLNTYDSPTRSEATADKDEIITEVDVIKAKTDQMLFDSTSYIYSHPRTSAQVTLDPDDLDQISDDVWTHSTRELTAGTKDAEIDAIKAKTDQITFDSTTGYINATVTNTGNNLVSIQLYETGGSIPIPNAIILVRNSDDTVDHTKVTTDVNGQAQFYADNVDLNLRISKSMYSFTVPENITVLGDTDAPAIYGTPIVKSVTVTPGLQTIYGRILKVDGEPDVGQKISATVKDPKVVDNALLSRSKLSDKTDANGDFELRVFKGATILLAMTNYFSDTVVVTQDDTKDFLDYIEV